MPSILFNGEAMGTMGIMLIPANIIKVPLWWIWSAIIKICGL